ncbi:TPA: hypothetical protein ACX6RO_001771 [Photobacterium damselae]
MNMFNSLLNALSGYEFNGAIQSELDKSSSFKYVSTMIKMFYIKEVKLGVDDQIKVNVAVANNPPSRCKKINSYGLDRVELHGLPLPKNNITVVDILKQDNFSIKLLLDTNGVFQVFLNKRSKLSQSVEWYAELICSALYAYINEYARYKNFLPLSLSITKQFNANSQLMDSLGQLFDLTDEPIIWPYPEITDDKRVESVGVLYSLYGSSKVITVKDYNQPMYGIHRDPITGNTIVQYNCLLNQNKDVSIASLLDYIDQNIKELIEGIESQKVYN